MPILILNNVWFRINLRFYSTCQLEFETSETLTCEIIRVFCQYKIWETKCFHIISLLSGETIEILKQSHVWFFFSFSVGSSPEISHHLSSRIQCKHFSGGIGLSVYITCIIYLMLSVSSFMIKKINTSIHLQSLTQELCLYTSTETEVKSAHTWREPTRVI